MLWYFIPVTIVATPLGQMVGDRISTDMVEAVGGILVSFVAVFEVYQKRELFSNWFCGCFKKKQNGWYDHENEIGVQTSVCRDVGRKSSFDRHRVGRLTAFLQEFLLRPE